MKKLILIGVLLLFGAGLTFAQDTTSEPSSTVNYYFAACENQGVIDLDGTMQSGYDLYVQIFNGFGATGDPLTTLIRIPVSNTYQVSQTLTYANGAVLALGQFASARVSIAAESDPSDELFSTVIDDAVDGCVEPSYGSSDTFDAGTTAGGATPIIDPETGNVVDVAAGEVIRSSGIYTPNGGVLNEVVAVRGEAVVQIGARRSETPQTVTGRTSDPGLIFAECDAYEGADPGVLFDTDNLTVFWSWFATTPELVREHIATAQYEVFLSSPYAYRQVFPDVVRTPVVQREDGNYWVFYVADLGDGFRPGQYRVDYYVTWERAISDGIEQFGPGTLNPSLLNTCTFDVEINPFGITTSLNNPTFPLQS
ncbi:MAG: hypothetical protein KC496_08960, partial [Anaerolineae bacterium]|nr:hypothetical protein [Anaerolineae bacterium]